VLRQCLRDALTAGVATSNNPLKREKFMNNLDITAHWELLLPNSILIPELINENISLHAPT